MKATVTVDALMVKDELVAKGTVIDLPKDTVAAYEARGWVVAGDKTAESEDDG